VGRRGSASGLDPTQDVERKCEVTVPRERWHLVIVNDTRRRASVVYEVKW